MTNSIYLFTVFRIPFNFSPSVGKKQLFWFFQRWLMCRQKTKCAVCAAGFYSSNFNGFHDFLHYAQR